MNKTTMRCALLATLMLGCSAWSQAQETESPAPKPPKPKALLDARAKYREKNLQTKSKAKAEAAAKALDINRAPKVELLKLPGITEAYADAIIAKRPYKSKADLVTKKALPMGIYQTVSKLVAAK